MRRYVCEEGDYTAGTETCAAPHWVEDTGAFPALSVEDSFAVIAAIASCWLVGFWIKQARRSVD